METVETIRRVPWTCRWGRFGGPVVRPGDAAPGFCFWVCDHPQAPRPSLQVLERDMCASCPFWEPAPTGSW